jgi:ketosteroid isomerase-like protein
MKKLQFLIMTLLFLSFYSCQEKIDVEKEKAAIIKVLNEEGSTFAANDLEGVCALHVQDETATRYDGYKIYKGWDQIKSLYESYISLNSQDTSWQNPKNIKENIIIKVTGNTAWLICDNIWKYEFNNQPQQWGNIQIAFFEKQNGEWKISFNAFVPKRPTEQ